MKLDHKVAEEARLIQALQRKCGQMPMKFCDLTQKNIYELSDMHNDLKNQIKSGTLIVK
jgi:hypothetical protein